MRACNLQTYEQTTFNKLYTLFLLTYTDFLLTDVLCATLIQRSTRQRLQQ